jgi:pimeloyl-ACP methyl ester carboxylesterase
MPFFARDELNFHYLDIGRGIPFFFQHGLGGDVNQPSGLFKPPSGFRLLSFDCRGHGETRPLGAVEKIGIAIFADDLLALMDSLSISRAVIGGISMGAAVALNFTLRFSDRVLGLILSRPAWLIGPMLRNAEIYSYIAQLIRQHGHKRGLERFKKSEYYIETLRESPAAADSLLGQFEALRAAETAVKLERISSDAPLYDHRELAAIAVPTLVVANRQDPIHPFEYGEILAREIPKAEFKELTSKAVNQERHGAEVQTFIEAFLHNHFCPSRSATC